MVWCKEGAVYVPPVTGPLDLTSSPTTTLPCSTLFDSV
jgi:hypothetical protein